MIQLRGYQHDLIESTREAMRRHKRVLIQGPTGMGKTVIAGKMGHSLIEKRKRAFFICHRRELIDQTSKTFDSFGIPHGFTAAGRPMSPEYQIYIASIDTLKNRLGKIKDPDMLFWDEAHHVAAGGWAKVQKHYSSAWHVGLSATPQRLDGKGLGDFFDHLVPGPSVRWLIENGFLAEYKLFSVPGVDLSGVRTQMGEFARGAAAAAMDKPSITGDIIQHWQRHARERLTIGFAVSRKHSEQLAADMRGRRLVLRLVFGTGDAIGFVSDDPEHPGVRLDRRPERPV